MNKFLFIYDKLFKVYGKQGWWPTTLSGELHPSYHGKKPNDKQRFEIVVGAILTQNTSWSNVEKAIFELNKADVLSVDSLRRINVKKLAKLIRSAGYYNQKAERLKLVADFFCKNKSPSRDELLSVKGVGPETADSVLLYAFDRPFFVVDAYTKRIFFRVGFCGEKCGYGELQCLFHKQLPKDSKLFNEFHALLVELAKNYCKKTPVCVGCPLFSVCKRKV